MAGDLMFETDRFNLSEVKPHFVNPCCFGEDLAEWLRGRLAEKGMEVSEPGQEDWGWYVGVTYKGESYFVGVGGNADESPAGNRGEWRIMVERRRPLWRRLSGQDNSAETLEAINIIREVLESEPGFANVRDESGS